MVGTDSRPAVRRESLLMKASWFEGVTAGDRAEAATSPAGINEDLGMTSGSSSAIGTVVVPSG
jgi:hypothetical protein